MNVDGRQRGKWVVLLALLAGCSAPATERDSPFSALRTRIQREFPAEVPAPLVPGNNPQSPDKVALGEALFFDPNLSACGTVACASCHMPERGFSDGLKISIGCGGMTGRRNSNSIYNTAYQSHLFWDGRAQSLEQQALGPVVDPAEMASSWDNVVHYLSTGEHPLTGQQFPESQRFYRGLFNRLFSGEITSTNVARALAAYERSVVSRDAPFDRWLQGDDSALSLAQKRGAMVFFGRGKCSKCHVPPNFTDSDFHNVAVPRKGFETPEMFPHNAAICSGIAENVDPGRAEVPFLRSSCSDLGKFKTPSLRNVELTAPYMHNGAFSALEDVLQHYWSVGRGTTTPVLGVLDERVTNVRLTDFGGHPEDIANLAAFLKALTGTQVKGPRRGISAPGNEEVAYAERVSAELRQGPSLSAMAGYSQPGQRQPVVPARRARAAEAPSHLQ